MITQRGAKHFLVVLEFIFLNARHAYHGPVLEGSWAFQRHCVHFSFTDNVKHKDTHAHISN